MRLNILNLTVLIFCLSQAALGLPGQIDLSFGSGNSGDAGRTQFTYGLGQDDVGDVLAMPDGKTVVAGGSHFWTGGNRGILVKYNYDGTLDTSFGVAGKFISPAYNFDSILAVKALPDGRFIIVSRYNAGRVNADGTLDTSFGTGGVVTMPAGIYYKIAVQPDGKILIAGNNQTSAECQFVFVRLNSDGSYDQSFGTGGTFILDNNHGWESPSDIAAGPDGSIVATGSNRISGSQGFTYRVMAVKLTPGGSLDKSFGENGRAIYQFDAAFSSGTQIKVRDDGKIFIGGQTYQPESQTGRPFVLRLDAGGSLDTSFNGTGMTFLQSVLFPAVKNMLFQADGKILVVQANAITRVTSSGTPDPAFGSRGTRAIDSLVVSSAAIHQDGRIALGGRELNTLTLGNGNNMFNINLLMIAPDGAPSAEFGGGGQVVTDVGEYGSYNSELFTLPNGKFLSVGGLTDYGGRNYGGIGIARFNADGTPDRTLAGDGNLALANCLTQYTDLFTTSAAMQGDRIIAGCTYLQSIFRLTQDGVIDPGFGTDGTLHVPFAPIKIAAQPDGKILAYLNNGYLYRYDADGAPDAKFGDGGRVAAAVGALKALIVQPDGKILLGGNYRPDNINSISVMRMARFNADGSADPGFGAGGSVTASSGSPLGDFGMAFLLGNDGKITIAGNNGSGGNTASGRYIEVWRFMPNGQLDVEFGQSGFNFIQPLPYNSYEWRQTYSAALQNNGKLVIFGQSNTIANFSMRIDAAGNIDGTWGSYGTARIDMPIVGSSSMKIDQNGQAVIANSGSGLINLARLQTGEPGVALIAGRIVTAGGRSILNAQISVSDANGIVQTAHSTANGRYYLRNLPAGQTYTVTVNGRRYTFAQPSVNIALDTDRYGVDFVANE